MIYGIITKEVYPVPYNKNDKTDATIIIIKNSMFIN